MKYFKSYKNAMEYLKNTGLNVKPEKISIWLDYQWCEIWSIKNEN